MRLLKQRTEDETFATSSLLRFNVLSRKSTTLNSKAAKTEEATDYLLEEMKKIEMHLDKLLAPPRIDQTHIEDVSDAQAETDGSTNTERNISESELQDPESIQPKGRQPLPKRMKPLIEEIKEKMKQQEMKKMKRTAAKEKSGKYDF